ISVAPNPQSLLMFTSATLLGKKVLAVNCQSSQTIQFILPDTFERYEPTPTLSSDLLSYNGKWGSAFYMRPRQTVGGEDDRIQLTYDEARGFGINDLFFMGDDDETLVTASFITSGIFSYQFKNFANVSNLVWDYINFRNGRVVNNVFYPGTGEYGFRGLAGDQDNNIFLSSRGDNQVYKIPAGTLATSKATDLRNTTGYPFDDRRHMLTTTPDFDLTPTDTDFPRLSALVSDCPKELLPSTTYTCHVITNPTGNNAGTKTAADRVWVLGMGSNKVYRLVVTGTTATMTSSGSDVTLNKAQNLVWYPFSPTNTNPSLDLLYIANTIGNTIEVVRAETLAHVTTINTVNP
ncbi:MAG: hypothetical protein J0L93_10105, partial [Deltaproteobacteria bacterium]|nr:hypothetical protein [Deltaproteobacteria bacterium]